MSVEYSKKKSYKDKYMNSNGTSSHRESDSKINHDSQQFVNMMKSIPGDEMTIPPSNSSNIGASLNEENKTVVFERIVPSAVKKMWVKAEESGTGYIDQDYPQHQEKKITVSPKGDNSLSFQYGDALLSHDVAKEDSERTGRSKRSDSISEKSEIPHVKGVWGVDLKHINDSDKLPFGFPKLKRVTSGSKHRPKSSLIDDNFSLTSNFSSKQRSRSVDALDQIDGESSFSEDYPSELSVQQRRKNFFENEATKTSNSKPLEFDKYAYLHAKGSIKDGLGNVDLRSGMNNSKIFYQPQNNSMGMDAKNCQKDKNITRPTRSLQELLKHDQKNLEGRIISIDKNDANNNQENLELSEASEMKQKPYISTDDKMLLNDDSEAKSILHGAKVESGITKNVEQIHTDKMTTQPPPKKEYVFSLENNTKKVPSKEQKLDKNIDNYYDKNAVSVPNNVSNAKHSNDGLSSQKHLISITKSNQNSNRKSNVELALDSKQLEQKHNKEKNQHHQQREPRKKQQQSQAPIQHHHDQQPQTESSKRPSKQQNSHQQEPQRKRHQESQPIQPLKQESQLRQQNELKKTNELYAGQQKQHPVQEVQYNKLGQVILEKDNLNKKTKENNLSAGKNGTTPQTTSSPSGIRRRVGKLIIMTGEQRDQQLKELAASSSAPAGGPRQITMTKQIVDQKGENTQMNGISLTFMSNEVADDDPDELPLAVPQIIFNSPVVGVSSIIAKKESKNKQKKKARVHFNNNKLSIVHSYPSESSYLDETDPSGKYSHAAAAVQNERERLLSLHQESPSVNDGDQHVETTINLVAEGEHYNSHFQEEAGSAMLF